MGQLEARAGRDLLWPLLLKGRAGRLRSIPTYTLSKRTGNGARHGTHASLATLGTLRGTAPPHPFRTVTLTWLIGPIWIPPDRAKFAPVYFPSASLVGAEQRTHRSLVIDEVPSLPRTECKGFGIRLRRGI